MDGMLNEIMRGPAETPV